MIDENGVIFAIPHIENTRFFPKSISLVLSSYQNEKWVSVLTATNRVSFLLPVPYFNLITISMLETTLFLCTFVTFQVNFDTRFFIEHALKVCLRFKHFLPWRVTISTLQSANSWRSQIWAYYLFHLFISHILSYWSKDYWPSCLLLLLCNG